jgi:hypothetical protein
MRLKMRLKMCLKMRRMMYVTACDVYNEQYTDFNSDTRKKPLQNYCRQGIAAFIIRLVSSLDFTIFQGRISIWGMKKRMT